jgi:hypothetical protein
MPPSTPSSAKTGSSKTCQSLIEVTPKSTSFPVRNGLIIFKVMAPTMALSQVYIREKGLPHGLILD